MISVIVPIYNVEAYLRECVDSIISQTYKDIEIILVDDGSPDNCPKICDEYAAMDSRIKVIHKENGGLSDARNAGIGAATGDYVYCVDSDDYIDDSELFEKIMRIYSEQEPCIVTFYVKKLINNRIVGSEFTDYSDCSGDSAEDVIFNSVKSDKLHISACEMFIKRDFLIDNDLFFVKGIKSEDIERGYRLYAKKPKVAFYNQNPYIYRRREGSITATVDYQHLKDYCNIVIDGIKIAESLDGKLRKALLGYSVYHLSIILALLERVEIKKEELAGLDQRLKPLCKKYITKYALSKKSKLVAFIYTIFRYKGTKKILGVYLKNR